MSEKFNILEEVYPGDTVMCAIQPGDSKFYPSTAVKVTENGLEVLVWTFDGSGVKGTPKGPMRHVSDPFWADLGRVAAMISDNDGGCFQLHPRVAEMKSLQARLDQLEESLGEAGDSVPLTFQKKRGRKPKSETAAEPTFVVSDPSKDFREPGVGARELTADEKQARAEALKNLGVGG